MNRWFPLKNGESIGCIVRFKAVKSGEARVQYRGWLRGLPAFFAYPLYCAPTRSDTNKNCKETYTGPEITVI